MPVVVVPVGAGVIGDPGLQAGLVVCVPAEVVVVGCPIAELV